MASILMYFEVFFFLDKVRRDLLSKMGATLSLL